MAKKTSSDLANTINWIRELHWKTLRLSREYRNDFEALCLWLRAEASKGWGDFNSPEQYARAQDAKESLQHINLLSALRPDADLSRFIPVQKRKHLRSDLSLFMQLTTATRRAAHRLRIVEKFRAKWDLRCPLPPQCVVPWDADVFTGRYAQPIRKTKFDETRGVLELLLFVGIGREITTGFVVGLVEHFLPRTQHWSDWFRRRDVVRWKFESQSQFEQFLEEHGVLGKTLSRKSEGGTVSVKPAGTDEIRENCQQINKDLGEQFLIFETPSGSEARVARTRRPSLIVDLEYVEAVGITYRGSDGGVEAFDLRLEGNSLAGFLDANGFPLSPNRVVQANPGAVRPSMTWRPLIVQTSVLFLSLSRIATPAA